MRLLSVCFCILLTQLDGFSQNWLSGVGGAGNDESLDITYENQGGYISSGFFSYGVDFGGTVLSSVGEVDAYVAKTDQQGSITWVKQFGGTGSDAAYANAIDAIGNIYVAGYYSGEMTVDATTIASTNNSQDVFLAKLDPSGNLIWIQDFGGFDHDFVYDLALDQNGNAVITGNFKGTVSIGSETYNSVIDPEENEPSYDIFVVKYDPDGNVLWSKHGQAIYEDRGTGLAINGSNEIALIGQFSDTLTFSETYNNQVYNTGFVMMMDSDGDELWMKRMSASMCIPYDIVLHQDSLMYITGDFTGQLAIFTAPLTTTNSGFSKKIFLTKMNTQGDVLWLENDGSDSHFSSRAVDVDAQGNAYISGFFKCRLDEYSQEYGEGVFYSAGHRDVFATKYTNDGVREWERQFGGPGDDVAWDLTVQTLNEPVISGAFSKYFHAPNSGSFAPTGWTTTLNLDLPNSPFFTYCSDGNYGQFATIESTGHQDILLAKPVDLAREPYDFFERGYNNNCIRDMLSPCINWSCLDTIESCEPVSLEVETYIGSNGFIGPEYEVSWSTGQTSVNAGAVGSGEYWVQVDRRDGCYTNSDTVTVIIHPNPTVPLISDDVIVNTESPSPERIFLCHPDTVELVMSNVDTVNNIYGWETQSGLTHSLDTVVHSSGFYHAHHISPYGCEEENVIEVQIDDWANEDTLDPHILIGTSPNDLSQSDTIFACADELIYYLTIDSSHYQSVGLSMPYFQSSWSISFPTISSSISHFDWYYMEDLDFTTWMMGHHFIATQSTWVIIDVELFDHCNGDTNTYNLHHEFYLDVSGFSVQEYGPHRMCPGDTIQLGVNGGDIFQWNGPHYTGSDTSAVLNVIGEGEYEWFASILTPAGTLCTEHDTMIVRNLEAPNITMIPSHGIICPNDSVYMTAPSGTDYIWVGPNNSVVGSSQSIYASTPGFYFCQFINPEGCFLISNEVEVRGFNSPYIEASPQQTICEGGTVTLTVFANENSFLDWPEPLQDNVLEQNVYQAGYYEVAVTFCGITDTVSLTVIDVSPEVDLSIAGFDTICAGEVLQVEGPPGYYSYEWSTGSQDTEIEVTQSGIYYLSAENFDGCIGHSDTLHVDVLDAPNAPLLSDTTVCYEGSAISYALGATDSVYWFNETQEPLGIAIQIESDSITSYMEYYGAHFNGECYSLYDTASVHLFTDSSPPGIVGNSVVCSADSLTLSAVTSQVLTYSWLLPDASVVFGDQIQLGNPDTGLYTLIAEHPVCGLDSTEQYVSVIEPGSYSVELISGNLNNCEGDSVVLSVSGEYAELVWNPSIADADSILILNDSEIWASIVDTNGCSIATDTVNLVFQEPPSTTDNPIDTICNSDQATLELITTFQVQVWTGAVWDSISIPFESDFVYADTSLTLQFLSELGCASDSFQWNIVTVEMPEPPSILGDTSVCATDSLMLWSEDSIPQTYTWTLPNGSTIVGEELEVAQPEPGQYTVQADHLYCQTQSDSTIVLVLEPEQFQVEIQTGDLLNCVGDTVVLAVDGIYDSIEWMPEMNINDSIVILDNEQIYALMLDTNGCSSVSDTVAIQFQEPPQSGESTLDTVCAGEATSLLLTGGYDIHLWNGEAFVPITSPYQSAALLNDSVFSFQYVDALGCISELFHHDVEVIETPSSVDISGEPMVCLGDSLTLVAAPSAEGTITFFDGNNSPITVANAAGEAIIPIESLGQFVDGITAILNIQGCQVSSELFEPEILPVPSAPEFSVDTEVCPGDSLYLHAMDTTDLIHHWTGPNGFVSNDPLIAFEPLNPNQEGEYTLVVQQSICLSDMEVVELSIAPAPAIDLFSDTLICAEDVVELALNESFDEILWSTGESSEYITVADSGLYWVIVTNEFGCSDSDTTVVETMICTVSVSNIFTPNGDGINDTFKLGSEGMLQLTVLIYNRYGRLIYRWDNLDGEWDGTIQNNGFDANEGTFYFVGNYLDISGNTGTKKGFITLVR